LRGWKYLVFEGGTRVPFISWWPGHVKSGVSDQIVSLSDLLASFATLTGQTLAHEAGPDSLDILPALLGTATTPIRQFEVEHGIGGALAIRKGSWKFIPNNDDKEAKDIGSGANPNDPRFAAAIIAQPLLFNLADDPGETRNLAVRHPEKVDELSSLLEKIRHDGRSRQ
jgi:arylsulfatase A-like enzyme